MKAGPQLPIIKEIFAMKEKGYYTELFRREGGQLALHFYEPSVLDQHKESPQYNFHGNWFSTKENLPEPIEPSGIQQFVWARKADGTPCVAALRSHLITLSYKDQQHWQSKELSPDESAQAMIESRYEKPMLYGQWPDTMSRYAAVAVYLMEIHRIFEPESLFPALPEVKPDFLAPLSYNSKRSFIKFAQDLYTLLDIKPSVIAGRVNSPKKERLLNRNEKWNLVLLYFEERGILSTEIQTAIRTIKEIRRWRVKSAHTLPRAEKDQDYNRLQQDIVFELQDGLRSLLLAFALAEKGTTEVINKRVSELKVE
jgi:hypothetical protein